MEITNDLQKQVDTVVEMTLSNAEKWVDLFQKIPISNLMQTSLKGLSTRENFIDCHADNSGAENMVFWLILYLKKEESDEDDADLASACFYSNNKARIEDYNKVLQSIWSDDDYQRLVDINFFGFEGTWEQTVKKILEASDLLHPVTPPFVF